MTPLIKSYIKAMDIYNHIQSYLIAFWKMSEEMAPSLLFGVLVAGLLKVFMPTKWVQKRLSGKGLWASVKASLLGVPLPLCSCSVLPVAAHFRKSGATKTSTLAFLGSTPATGVDSMMATYGMLGPGIAIIRPVLAFFSGVFAGWVQSEEKTLGAPRVNQEELQNKNKLPVLQRLKMGIDYSINDVIPDLRKWLIIGLVIGAFIEILLPSDSLSFLSTNPWLAYGIVLAIGIPLYTCSTGSIPIALALMSKGLSPGAVVIFLAVGPTMSTASLGFVGGTFGRLSLFKYVGSIALVSLLVGVFVDWVAPFWSLIDVGEILHNHHAVWEFGFYSIVTMLFWGLMLKDWILKLFKTKKEESSCGCPSEIMSEGSCNMTSAKIIEVRVPDMSCGNCEKSIRKGLDSEVDVKVLSVNLESKVIQIETSHDEEFVKSKIEESGFSPESV